MPHSRELFLVIVLLLQLCCHKFDVFILQFTTAVYMTLAKTAQEDCGTKATRQWLLSVHTICPNQYFLWSKYRPQRKKKGTAKILQYKLSAEEKNIAFLCSYFCFCFLRTIHMEIKKIFTLNSLYRTEKQLGTVGTDTLMNLKINL